MKNDSFEMLMMKGLAKSEKDGSEVSKVKFNVNEKIFHSLFVTDEKYEKSIKSSNEVFKKAAVYASLLWIFLILMIHYFSPKESFELLTGVEQNASILAVALLLVSNVSRILPLVYKGGNQSLSGVIVGSIVVQSIAMITDALMAFTPTPVVIDPITKGRVHLMRWGEWIPLAFLMTFLTEGLDLPDHDKILPGYIEGFCQAFSTSLGLFLPFAPNFLSWITALVIAVIFFCRIHLRCFQKYKLLCATKKGNTVCEIEQYQRIYYSFKLIVTCAAMWSLLVVFHLVTWAAPMLATEDSILNNPALPMLTQTFCEIWSKVLYLVLIVDAHNSLFDESVRAERRLEELRHMMSVVWETSNDVITISLRNPETGKVITMVSPTYRKISSALKREKKCAIENTELEKAIVFELHKNDFATASENFNDSLSSFSSSMLTNKIKPKPKNIHAIKLSQPKEKSYIYENVHKFHFPGTASNKPKQTEDEELSEEIGLLAISKLILKAWQTRGNEDSIIIHDFEYENEGDYKLQEDESSIEKLRCEARVTHLDANSIVVIVRDISERFRRFEAEKTIIKETTARRKDAEANRFTRHEVKNGLLSAIALTENLREILNGHKNENPQLQIPSLNHSLSLIHDCTRENDKSDQSFQKCAHHNILELDATLHEVLDTILAQSMAKDLIHEAYEPKVETVDVFTVLYGSHSNPNKQNERFPLVTHPNPLPFFLFDPQLLRYVYRNAISNACKYGQKGGVVRTEIRYDSNTSEFQMDVINLPGEFHEKLIKLGEKAEEAVFAPEKRLHPFLKGKSVGLNSKRIGGMSSRPSSDHLKDINSSGDGAWIMRKCANTLNGEVSIKFLPEETVFSLRCPATPVILSNEKKLTTDTSNFRLPQNTWGVAIDDSKVQRRLMERFLSLVGIDKSRIIVMGKDADEIQNFTDYVVNKIEKNMSDYFLVIADENLDFVVETTHHASISGSRCVEQIRKRLDPELERNMLALVRSANDSSDDVAIYNKRAHAFLPKVPIKKEKVFEIIATLWMKRFVSESDIISDKNPQQSPSNEDEDVLITSADIMVSVESVDSLFDDLNSDSWDFLNEKLHRLKGDIKSLYDNRTVETISQDIDLLREPDHPADSVQRWQMIRSKILSML